jgi:hypothetical protein
MPKVVPVLWSAVSAKEDFMMRRSRQEITGD